MLWGWGWRQWAPFAPKSCRDEASSVLGESGKGHFSRHWKCLRERRYAPWGRRGGGREGAAWSRSSYEVKHQSVTRTLVVPKGQALSRSPVDLEATYCGWGSRRGGCLDPKVPGYATDWINGFSVYSTRLLSQLKSYSGTKLSATVLISCLSHSRNFNLKTRCG